MVAAGPPDGREWTGRATLGDEMTEITTEVLDELAAGRAALLNRVERLEDAWDAVQAASGADDRAGLVTADLAHIRHDLERRDYTVGLFGLVKRGKSTLLNALLGAELSPTHVTPETAVPVHVRYGRRVQAMVHLVDGEVRAVAPDEVGNWTSQKHNGANHRGVTHVEWSHPSSLLRQGVCLVDTPGLDDAEADEWYTRRTIQELSGADVGIVLFMSPPTVGATEMDFLRKVTAAHLDRTLLVCNFYPQHFADPATRDQVLGYVRQRVVEATGVDAVQILPICAQQAWEARRTDDEVLWAQSGGRGLLDAVAEVIQAHTGSAALVAAADALDRVEQLIRSSIDLRLRLLRQRDLSVLARLREHRERADGPEREFDRRLCDLDGTTNALRALVQQAFLRGRAAIAEAETPRELADLVGATRREVEVVTEDAYQRVRARLTSLQRDVADSFDRDVAASFFELGEVLPVSGMSGELPGRPIGTLDAMTSARGAALGGLVGGGATMAIAGSLLGPIGLLAGALLGWRLGGTLGPGRQLRHLREDVDRLLGEVCDALLEDFDRRVDAAIDVVREGIEVRREGFLTDLGAASVMIETFAPGSLERRVAVDTLTTVRSDLASGVDARSPANVA